MAEPFGIATWAVGIAAAFTACVDCFGYVQLGHHFERDFQTDLLALNCARLRTKKHTLLTNANFTSKLRTTVPDVGSHVHEFLVKPIDNKCVSLHSQLRSYILKLTC